MAEMGDGAKRLAELRKRQASIKEALKSKKAPDSVASASSRSQSGAPTPTHGHPPLLPGKRLSRQATMDGAASDGSLDVIASGRSGSVPSRRVSFQREQRSSLRAQEAAWELFTEDMREFHTTVSIQRGRIDGLSKSSQDAPTQTAELLQAAEAGALEQLSLPETQALLEAAKQSVETFNVMDKKRSQDVQLAIDGLWDALRTQSRQIQGVRGLSAGIAALEKGIEAQAGQIGELQHAVQEIYNTLYWAWEVMEAQEAVFEEMAAQLQEQHREEVQRIEFGLAIRERATDTLQVELPAAPKDGCSRERSQDSRSSTTTISVPGWDSQEAPNLALATAVAAA